MTNQLSDRLHRAVPEPPPLRGLAERAEAAGRRRRRTAVTGACAAMMVAVGAVVAVPALIDRTVEPARPTPATGCVDTAELVTEADAVGDVVALRFCGLDSGQTGGVRFPEGALTGPPAARFVDRWPRSDETCWWQSADREWRVQVALSSGDVYERSGNSRRCVDAQVFRELTTQIGQQLAFRYPDDEPGPLDVDCPSGLRADRTNQDGASAELLTSGDAGIAALSTTPLLALPATDGYVCRYVGETGDRRLVGSWRVVGETAEQLRTAAMAGYADGMTRCSGDRGAESFLVVLRDQTGTARTFAIDGTECNPLSAAIGAPAQVQYLGLAGMDLVFLISGTQT